jgi:hypothetical protein
MSRALRYLACFFAATAMLAVTAIVSSNDASAQRGMRTSHRSNFSHRPHFRPQAHRPAFRHVHRPGRPNFVHHPHRPRWVHHHHRCGWGRPCHVRWVRPYGGPGYVAPSYVAPTPVRAAPAYVAPTTNPCTCLTKEYTQDRMVIFRDTCTKEMASASLDPAPQQQTYAPQPAPQPDPQYNPPPPPQYAPPPSPQYTPPPAPQYAPPPSNYAPQQ